MDCKNSIFKNNFVFSASDYMKRSHSEMAFQEFYRSFDEEKRIPHKIEVVGGTNHGFFAGENGGNLPLHSVSSSLNNSFWSDNLSPNPLINDAKFGLRNPVDSAISASNSKDSQMVGASRDSSHEKSDDDEDEDEDDLEIEAGPCEQSTNPPNDKRIKRMVSNRLSAQRSRRKKQDHLNDLEQQVKVLQGENSSLFKQLSDATQQFKDAMTNNRVLKSNVEALRAKVELVEDQVARGSLTSSLSHLIQNYLNTTPQDYTISNLNHIDNFPQVTSACGDENSTYSTLTNHSITAYENTEALGGNGTTGVIDDTMSRVAGMWPWQSHDAPPSN